MEATLSGMMASRITANRRLAIALLATAVTVACVVAVNPSSLANFAWYFFVWNVFILFVNRDSLADFSLAFVVNSAWIGIYVLVQSTIYPDSYGTTTWHSASWTDDSYFFSLAADSVPTDVLTRPFYWEYKHTFTSMIRAISPLPIHHPLDVLFFQSGTAALLAAFTGRLMFQLSQDQRLSRIAFTLCMICPFLMMNGGVVFLRDTLAAALFVYSLCSLNDRRYVPAAIAVAIQLALRPGTGILLMPAYVVLYWREISAFVGRHPVASAFVAVSTVLGAVAASSFVLDYMTTHYNIASVGFLGREVIADLTADQSFNALFLAIQEMPFVVKLFLNAAYIFMYPFLTFRTVFDADYFDLRTVTLSLIVPVYQFWLNAWFAAGALTAKVSFPKQRAILWALALTLILVGIYSLQTRHKTIIYPLYYILVAVGFAHATPQARRLGYVFSAILLLVQVASTLR